MLTIRQQLIVTILITLNGSFFLAIVWPAPSAGSSALISTTDIKTEPIQMPSQVLVRGLGPATVPVGFTEQRQSAPKTKAPGKLSQSVAARSGVETVIAYAMAQRGKPYVWGAIGPNSFDCSGLVLSAFAKIGIRLPHFTGAIIQLGKPVSRQAMQRGDLIFPIPHHVGIYLGNGQMIDSPQAGQTVKIEKVWSFYAARRLA